MNKTTKKCLIILAISIILMISLFIYQNNNVKEFYLVCKYNGNTPDYFETMKFKYVDNELVGFYRNEEVLKVDETTYESYKKQIKDLKDDISSQTNEYFQYEYNEENNKFTINTYIDVKMLNNFFDNYLSNKNIKSNSTSDNIKNILESDTYICSITK